MQVSLITTLIISAAARCTPGSFPKWRQHQLAAGFSDELTSCERDLITNVCVDLVTARLHTNSRNVRYLCSAMMANKGHVRQLVNSVGGFKNFGARSGPYHMY